MSEADPHAPLMPVTVCERPYSLQLKVMSKRMRFTLFVHGIVLPGALLAMSLGGQSPLGEQPWQSGELKVYIAMLLQPAAWMPFAPPIIYAMISLGTWTIAPVMERKVWVRVGIYTGVLLALHYMVVLFLVLHVGMLIMAAVVWPSWQVALWGVTYYCRRQISIWHIMLLMTICALLFVLVQNVGTYVLFYPMTAIFFVLVATPILSFVAYIWAAREVFRIDLSSSPRDRKWVIVSLIGILIAWAFEWRFAIVAMLNEYSKLPTTNPNCYLSNAASHGHPLLTRGVRRGEVTPCMRRLKFLEIVFKVSLPVAHRFSRRWYDAYCPPIARLCQQYTPLATATCLLLIPLEVLAELLRWILRIERGSLLAIYAQERTPLEIRLTRGRRLGEPSNQIRL